MCAAIRVPVHILRFRRATTRSAPYRGRWRSSRPRHNSLTHISSSRWIPTGMLAHAEVLGDAPHQAQEDQHGTRRALSLFNTGRTSMVKRRRGER